MASGNDHWNTPAEIIDKVKALFGVIDLDPFSNSTSIVPAEERWDGSSEEGSSEDGFTDEWGEEMHVFVNGPWSRTKEVVEKCVDEWARHAAQIVAVIPTSLNASYWRFVDDAPAICRPLRRVSFLRDGKPVKGNRQDCVIVYWGQDIYRFRALFSGLGKVKFG